MRSDDETRAAAFCQQCGHQRPNHADACRFAGCPCRRFYPSYASLEAEIANLHEVAHSERNVIVALRVELVDTRTKLAEAEQQLADYGEPETEYDMVIQATIQPRQRVITDGRTVRRARLVRRTPWAALGDD